MTKSSNLHFSELAKRPAARITATFIDFGVEFGALFPRYPEVM